MDFKNMSIWKGENEKNQDSLKNYIKANYVSVKKIRKLINKYDYYLKKAEENQEVVMKRCYKDILEDLGDILVNRHKEEF